jgi:hypothetical protein
MFKQALLLSASLLAAATAFAGNDFAKVRGITDGSPYTLTADEGAAGRRGDMSKGAAKAESEAAARFASQLMSDGY